MEVVNLIPIKACVDDYVQVYYEIQFGFKHFLTVISYQGPIDHFYGTSKGTQPN